MKKLKKLNRRDLEQVKGAGISPIKHCNGCPTEPFGPGGISNTCESYWNLPDTCRNCVVVSVDCFVQIS